MNADVQVRATYGPRGETAFHAATRRRDIELMRLLSDNGSQVDAINASLINKKIKTFFVSLTMFAVLIYSPMGRQRCISRLPTEMKRSLSICIWFTPIPILLIMKVLKSIHKKSNNDGINEWLMKPIRSHARVNCCRKGPNVDSGNSYRKIPSFVSWTD